MNKTITLLVAGIFSLYASCIDIVSVSAQSRKTVVGMVTLDAKGGLSAEEASVISDQLQQHLVDTGVFEIVERGRIAEILQEQGFQQSGACNSTECAIEVGKIIGAGQMVTGSIGKVGKVFSFSVRVIDVETSRIVKAVSRNYEGPIEKLLTQIAREVAYEIAGLTLSKAREKGGKTWVWVIVGGVIAAGGGSAAMMLTGKGKTSGTSDIPPPPTYP